MERVDGHIACRGERRGLGVWLLVLGVVLVWGVEEGYGEFTSKNHAKLKAALEEDVRADRDIDGVLSYEEYKVWVEGRRHHRWEKGKFKGKVRGRMSMVLPTGELLITDFADSNMRHDLVRMGWKVEGEVFGHHLSQTTRMVRRRVGRYSGQYLLTSLVLGDGGIGRLLSPEFEVEMGYVEFLLSGGNVPGRVCVNLLHEGKVVRTATGQNDDRLGYVAFDVKAFKGKMVRIEIVDSSRDVWGHLNVDRIVQTEKVRGKRIISEGPKARSLRRGFVETLGGRVAGDIRIGAGGLEVDGKGVKLEEMLLAVIYGGEKKPGSILPHEIRFVNGERWRVRFVGYKDGKVGVESGSLGRREIPMGQVASLEFKPGIEKVGKAGMIYREGGEPIEGKLVWIRDRDIAVDCALGVVPLPRASVTRFVVQDVKGVLRGGGTRRVVDEVGLLDGSVLKGVLKEGGKGLSLQHGTLGVIGLSWESIRYVRRESGAVGWLDGLRVLKQELSGPVSPPPGPRVVRDKGKRALRVVRMMPGTKSRYETGVKSGRAVLRGRVAAVEGARAKVVVKILTGGKAVWSTEIGLGRDERAFSVALPKGEGFTIELSYAGAIAFPSGVDWLDAHVLMMDGNASDE